MTAARNDGDITAKIDPEELVIRAGPRPVTRINRRILFLLTGTGLLLILGATIFALDPPRLFDRDETRRELYRIGNAPKADGLDSLPKRYSDMEASPEDAPIELGPPLSGDIGPAVVELERNLGLQAPQPTTFRPNPEDDAERAERIRQARLAQQARESVIFFKLLTKSRSVGAQMNLPNSESSATVQNSGLLDDARRSGSTSFFGLASDSNAKLDGRKANFLNQDLDRSIYNSHSLQDPMSPYQVMAGSVISASLITGLNSDLPGHVIAQVTEAVYDSVSGQHLLIPQGSRVIGTYDSVVAFGQERALVVWQRIILPDGSSVVIENLPATDVSGYSGLEDEVDFHTWRLLKGIALSTLLGVSTELTFGGNESDLLAAIRGSTQNSANQIGQRLIERELTVQPSITVRPGWPLRIIVNKDLMLRPYQKSGVSQ